MNIVLVIWKYDVTSLLYIYVPVQKDLVLSTRCLYSAHDGNMFKDFLFLNQKLHPPPPMLTASILKRRTPTLIAHQQQLRTLTDQILHQLLVRFARPTGVMQHRPAVVVAYSHGHTGLVDEESHYIHKATSAGHVDEALAELVGALELSTGLVHLP